MIYIFFLLGVIYSNADHLIFNRIVLKPDNAEFVSIFNPTSETINLSNYYITDSNIDDYGYYNLPSGSNFWPENPTISTLIDFIARFPDQDIASNDSLVFSIKTADLFFSYYNYYPDISLFEDMLDLNDQGTISCNYSDNCNSSDMNILSDDEEMLMLFYWDGISNTVTDVDYFLWGDSDQAIDKTDIGDYLDDTAQSEQQFQEVHSDGFCFHRIDHNEGNEINLGNGNGITGDDETSEDLTETWNIISHPEYGCTDAEAINFDESATIDDGSCTSNDSDTEVSIDEIIHHCGEEAGESLECDGKYDLSSQSASQCPLYGQQVTTSGIIIDYFDITPFDGPHSFTIRDSETGGVLDFVVWPESSSYQDGFNILDSDLAFLTQQPFGQYEVQITGELGAYCDDDEQLDINSEWQITVEYENYIIAPEEYTNDGTYNSSSQNIANITPSPYVLIPDLGEKLNYSYSFPDDSQIRIRIFDLSGRFITSLISEYREFSGTVNMANWDGKNEVGQIMSPGTYLMHMEAYIFSTSQTFIDIAPVVIGVNK